MKRLYIILVLVILGAPLNGENQFSYIYRGQMGTFGVLENIATHRQRLIRPGDRLSEGYRVVSITPQAIILKQNGRQIRIERKSGYTQAHLEAYTGPVLPAYQRCAWQDELRAKLKNTFTQLTYRGVDLAKVLATLSEESQVPMMLDPRVLVYHSPLSLKVHLSTSKLSLKRALDLLVTSLGLTYYLSKTQGVVVTLPNLVPPPDENEKIRRNLARARDKLRQQLQQQTVRLARAEHQNTIMRELRRRRLVLDYSEMPIEKLVAQIAQKTGLTIIIAPSALLALPAPRQVTLISGEVCAQEALDQLCQATGLKWRIMGSSIYLANPKRMAKLTQQNTTPASHSTTTQALLNKRLKVNLTAAPLHKVVKQLEQQGISLIIGREIWCQKISCTLHGEMTLQAILDHLSQQAHAAYIFMEGRFYLVR